MVRLTLRVPLLPASARERLRPAMIEEENCRCCEVQRTCFVPKTVREKEVDAFHPKAEGTFSPTAALAFMCSDHIHEKSFEISSPPYIPFIPFIQAATMSTLLHSTPDPPFVPER